MNNRAVYLIPIKIKVLQLIIKEYQNTGRLEQLHAVIRHACQKVSIYGTVIVLVRDCVY